MTLKPPGKRSTLHGGGKRRLLIVSGCHDVEGKKKPWTVLTPPGFLLDHCLSTGLRPANSNLPQKGVGRSRRRSVKVAYYPATTPLHFDSSFRISSRYFLAASIEG